MSQIATMETGYAGPRSHAPLHLTENGCELTDGVACFPIRDGIPYFLELPAAETADESAGLDRLNRLAVERGWRGALAGVYGEGSGMFDYVTNASRAEFLSLLPIGRQSKVLEIGPGLGQFTAVIAGKAESVSALEVVHGQARFVRERCRQAELTNVEVACGGDTCRLPYADSSFDVAICNLVFEWCGSRNDGESPAVVQRRLLSEFSRVLKSGGALWLATKNRFALRYLIGKGDEHAHGMRFGHALPRPLMHLMLKLKGKGRPQGALHSYGALRGMLIEAGFGDVKSFWAAPEMRKPTHLVPADADSIRKARSQPAFVQGEMRSTRVLMPLVPAALVKHVTPGLAFLARKTG